MAHRILVTGGAGFIGSTIAFALRKRDAADTVIAFDNLRRRGAELNVDRLRRAGISFVHGDIRNLDDLSAAGDADVLIECGGEASVLSGYSGSPHYVLQANLNGAMNCLEYARIRRSDIIYLSSSRVYPIAALQSVHYREDETRFSLCEEQMLPGATAHGFSEQFPLEGARSLYGATKLCGEHLLHEYIAAYGLRGVINRCGLIAGPWQMGKIDQGVIAQWLAAHVYKQPLAYIGFAGSGKQVRDVLHVADLARLVEMQLSSLEHISGEVFNIGGGLASSTSLVELTARCRRTTGNSVTIDTHTQTRPADIPLYVTDSAKVRATLRWEPQRTLEQTLEDTYAWMRDNQAMLEAIFI